MTPTVISKNGIAIRLTDERWAHITEEHGELAGMWSEVLETLDQPMRIRAGGRGEFLAIWEQELGKFPVVIYRELENDSFVITAFLTRKIHTLSRRGQIWP